jgi:hypothetical protein
MEGSFETSRFVASCFAGEFMDMFPQVQYGWTVSQNQAQMRLMMIDDMAMQSSSVLSSYPFTLDKI